MTRPRSNAIGGCLQPGDIMIKHSDGSIISKIIRFGQLFGRGPSKFVHAGIASSGTTIIEMDEEGLQENNLLIKNADYKYDVFRCNYSNIQAGATETARMMLDGFGAPQAAQGGSKISYSTGGAARSISKRRRLPGGDVINNTLDNLLSAGGDAFFCSGHVVLCYQSAMGQAQMAQNLFPVQHSQQLFSLDSTCYQPSFLWKTLEASHHFTKIGTVKGAVKIA